MMIASSNLFPQAASTKIMTIDDNDDTSTVKVSRRKLSMELATLERKLVGRTLAVVSEVYQFCSQKMATGFKDFHVVLPDLGEYNTVLAKHSEGYQRDQVVYAELRENNVVRVRLLSIVTPFCPAKQEERKPGTAEEEPLGGVAVDLFDAKDLNVNTLTVSSDGFVYYTRRDYRGGLFRYDLETGRTSWCKVTTTVAAKPSEYEINWDRVTLVQAAESGRIYVADDRTVFLLRDRSGDQQARYTYVPRTVLTCHPVYSVSNGREEPVIGVYRIMGNSGYTLMRYCFGGKVYVGDKLVARLDGSSRLCWLGGCHEILLQFSCASGSVSGFRLVDNCTRLSEQFSSVLPRRWCRSAEGIACVTPGGKVCILGVGPDWSSLVFEMSLEYKGGVGPECPVDTSGHLETVARRLRRHRFASTASTEDSGSPRSLWMTAETSSGMYTTGIPAELQRRRLAPFDWTLPPAGPIGSHLFVGKALVSSAGLYGMSLAIILANFAARWKHSSCLSCFL
ncbi:hypothetical protein FOL47_000851 [Perkinsus chesapeaki]|uniref:Uncharacterized protein n=1 Tax=Perkinsus chesapeaki TaxID=330153 RepID=A0A7J6MKV6_PERCH|nr:hypothetical protein FOL47_000851 [Perkinsus chesapeaki]